MFGLKNWWRRAKPARTAVVVLASSSIVLFIYLWRLGNLTAGLSFQEAAARASSRDFWLIWHYPLNAPHRLLQLVFQEAGHHGAFWMRLPSVLFSLVFIILFYNLIRRWFGKVIGVLSTLILAGTPWVIASGRSATANVMLLSPIVLMSLYLWFVRTAQKGSVWIALCLAVAICCYIPGSLWLILIGGFLARKRLNEASAEINKNAFFLGILIAIIFLLPLALAGIRDWTILRSILLIPASLPDVLSAFRDIGWSILGIFWQTKRHEPFIIGRLPIFNVLQLSLLVFGIFALFTRARRNAIWLISTVAAGVVLCGINDNFSLITFVIPALSVFVAAGLRYLYVQWRQVFPRNPLPLYLALFLMSAVVALHLLYGVRYSLIAWPHTTATKTLYVLK